ncbi:zinc/cadmium/mercury/lead-transporting ATPase [Gilliamella sp. wkB108]|uniref:zinc/cadmium/mercury/lead-transporting ATPase n=1 Tax=Gilliamella sp. wkB108 TaxID=3120256 RepID=UPI00080E9855|nr:zinc/cadmium/mercury/lead-transporting ATPase [Gilliamella apicola]OCG28582.1 zinc/cadmium/mercury/lead-transporting ATPase [Gilliamella apicola]
MLYNNKSIYHHHEHHHNCHDVCHNIAHNHNHTPHDVCCSQETTHCCGGDSHNPTQTNEFNDPPEEPERQSQNPKLIWKIQGMDCAHCAQKIENGLKTLPNIIQVTITFATEKLIVVVNHSDEEFIKQIEDKIIELGYKPIFETTSQPIHQHEHTEIFDKAALIPLAILAGLIVISYLILLFNHNVGEYAFIITAIIGLLPITKEAFTLMRNGTPFAIETLMSISAIGALFIGAAEEATMVIFLFMIGEMLEGVASYKAKTGISSLIKLMPEETIIITNGKRQTVASHSLKPGDIIEISSGGRLPADVILMSEQASIDESALTGESIPVNYLRGDKILAGSLVVDTTIELKVISETGQNAVDRILQLIEDAQDRKASIERFIDKFSRYYTPSIALFALLVIIIPPLFMHADWYTWIYRGLTLLLIGCPCALVISTPAVITSALSSAAKQGVLIKGGAALERIGSVKMMAFDKTGTLTAGKPQVTDISCHDISQEQLLSIAAAIESGSHHPLAKAIVDYVKQNQISFVEADNRKAIAGIGIQGNINQETFYIVSPNKIQTVSEAISDENQQIIHQLESAGKTVVVVVTKVKLLGIIALQDILRTDAKTAINELHHLGLQSIMLTGDNQRVAKAIAGQLNMDYRAELLPADKLTAIETLSHKTSIAMVGDGINDSPAMKAATVGIAMGSGSDVALETADVALTKNSLLSLPKLIRLTRFANRNIKQNITIALGIKAIFLVTSLLGFTGLWLAVLADSGTTAIVTINALRLLKFKK